MSFKFLYTVHIFTWRWFRNMQPINVTLARSFCCGSIARSATLVSEARDVRYN